MLYIICIIVINVSPYLYGTASKARPFQIYLHPTVICLSVQHHIEIYDALIVEAYIQSDLKKKQMKDKG